MQRPAIVVGADGTESSTAAVIWAAHEAALRRLPLHVVHVLDWDWSVSRYDYQGDHFAVARRLAAGVAEAAAERAIAAAPEIEVAFEVPVGHPYEHLLRRSQSAALTVLGSRGRGGLAGLLIGSVSRRMAANAHCPIAVVRGHTGAGRDAVAVGVDDSEHADAMLDAAFGAARDRGARLVVVHCYQPSLALPLGRIPVTEIRTPDQDTTEGERLAAHLAPWRAKYPDITVETLLSHDSPAAVLSEISHGTRLIVVGSHGRSLLTGTVLGSTVLQVVQHADCPVLVVPRSGDRDR